jgi:uncharacterized membrane protein
MRTKRKGPLLIFLFGGLISCVVYYTDAYPTILLKLAEDFMGMEVAVLAFVYAGFLFSYLAFFIWPDMPRTMTIIMSVLFLLFLNMCFISVKFPRPLGIVFILVGAIFIYVNS